jgi:glycosyltransferase involved in cell wall biosynthesis
MNAPRKILYIDTALRIWGGQRSLYELICNLDRDRYVPTVAVPEGSQTSNLYGDMAETYTFPAHSAVEGRPTKPIQAFRSIISISRLIKDIRPDVIHANTFLAALFVSLIPFLDVPWILHQRDFKDHGVLSRWAGRRASRIIAVTNKTAIHLGKRRLKNPPFIVPDGVSLSFTGELTGPGYKPVLRAKYGIKKDDILVGTVGTISELKSQRDILDAADRLRDVPGIYFICVGEPYRDDDYLYFDGLKKKRAELRLERRVFFEGFTDDLASIYGSIDILAHPAEREGLGRVILEAMGAGVPVIAKDCYGPAEIITSGVDGVLSDPNDFDDFAGKLKLLVDDENYRKRLGDAGKKKVADLYTVERSTRRIQEIYDGLLGVRNT